MKRYDPLVAPDPDEWLALDEHERMSLVEDYHRRARIRLPNAKLHAVVHAIVENQIALGDATPARRTADRLIAEGLDRHETIHAIGMVLMEFVHDLNRGIGREPNPFSGPDPPYFAALDQLTAKSWRLSGD
jgi:hypothetical protein